MKMWSGLATIGCKQGFTSFTLVVRGASVLCFGPLFGTIPHPKHNCS